MGYKKLAIINYKKEMREHIIQIVARKRWDICDIEMCMTCISSKNSMQKTNMEPILFKRTMFVWMNVPLISCHYDTIVYFICQAFFNIFLFCCGSKTSCRRNRSHEHFPRSPIYIH